MRLITEKQKDYLFYCKLKKGEYYAISDGMTFYEKPCFDSPNETIHIPTNFYCAKHIVFDKKVSGTPWCLVHLTDSKCGSFYMREKELTARDLITISFYYLVFYIPFVIKNLLTK